MKNQEKVLTFLIKHYLITAFVVIGFGLWAKCFTMISPGYVGIKINLLGDHKGAESKELTVGAHWISPWQRVYVFPVFEQNHTWEGREHFTFQTGEGLNVQAEIGVSYHLNEGSIHTLFCKYRRGIREITDVFIRNYIRDAVNKTASGMKIEDLYGEDKTFFIESVERIVKDDLFSQGINIDRIYLIGTLHFPDIVVNALNSKIEATQIAQKRENELREAEAAAKKQIATATGEGKSRLIAAESKAEADLIKARKESEAILLRGKMTAESNKLVIESITPELIKYEYIKKWDGALPKITSGNVMPLIKMEE